MKVYRTTAGPFRERPFYSDGEFEQITSTELLAVQLMPAAPEPVRIERFIEKRFKVTAAYEDLGPKVLGATVFGVRGVERIVVSSSLDDGSVVGGRRVRTTMGHESGHGLLHAHLFVLDQGGPPLFGDFSDPAAPRVMCREGDIEDGTARPRRDQPWYEYQANRAMSALLLPKRLVAAALQEFLEPAGGLGMLMLPDGRRDTAARNLAEIFDVNPAVVRFRLEQLYPASSGQRPL